MITYKEFEVIQTMLKSREPIADIPAWVLANKHYYVFQSAEEVAEQVESLEKKGYIADGAVTQSDMAEIEPLRVNNAVIFAAGGADISAKSVYNMPKGVFMKNG